jgi:hemerythrin-like domain-containing protein
MFYELRLEHARFGRVLALIGRRAGAWVDAPDAKTLQLLSESVDYIVNYQNRYHHPREERMFERIARRSADHAVSLAALRRDHDESLRAGQGLLRQLRRFEERPGSRVRRAELSQQLQDFARNMRGHIRREDELMYSSAPRVLRAADWRDLARSKPAPRDPLRTGPGAAAGSYSALAQYVATGEAEAHVVTRPSRPVEQALSRGTQLADQGITCLRLVSRQFREASELGFSTYAAAVRPRLPRDWSASLAKALNDQRAASARWLEEWKTHFGVEGPGAG